MPLTADVEVVDLVHHNGRSRRAHRPRAESARRLRARVVGVLALLAFVIALAACGRKGKRSCSLDSDCRTGRDCVCDPKDKTPEGACGEVGKETKGTCMSD